MRLHRHLLVVSVVWILALMLWVPVSAVNIVHLTYTSHGDKYHQYLQEKAIEFEKLHPGTKIDLIIGTHDKFDVMLAGGAPPDVVDLPDYEHLALEGLYINLLPLLERDGLLDAYHPQVLELLQFPGGGIYSMPLELSVIPTTYNRDLFNERGVPTPSQMGEGWTWDAVIDAGRKLTVDIDGDGNPEYFGIDRPWGAIWRIAAHQAGGAFYDQKIRPSRSLWNSPEVLAGIEWITEFYRNGITPHHRVADQTQFYFWTGRTAINLVDGPGIVGPYLADSGVDWDYYLQPMGPQYRATAMGAAGPHILASTEDADMTWRWVKFYAADEKNVQEWVQMTGRIPALVSVQPTYPDAVGISQKDFHFIFEQTVQPHPYSYILPLELNPRRVNLDPIWTLQVPPAAHLTTLHERYTAVIQELYGGE